MPNPPPKKPTPPLGPPSRTSSQDFTAANVRRRLTSDGFQAMPVPKIDLDADNASTELAKAASGIKRKLIGMGQPPPEVDVELATLTRGPRPHPLWHELLRVLLSPPAPTSPTELESDARRILEALQHPLARLPRSRGQVLERIRGLGVSASYLFRGADIVVAGGAGLYDELAPLAERTPPCDQPFPATLRIEIPTIGVLLLGRPPANEAVLQLCAHLAELRAVAPRLLAFFEQQVVKAQGIGPMGCSPRTLQAANPVRARCRA